MSDEKPGEDIWDADGETASMTTVEAQEAFVENVINRVHQRIFLHDLLLLVLVGFVGILLGFLNGGNARGGDLS